jgi:hypothetical protein
MPNLDNSVILEIVKTASAPGYSYAGLSGLDDTRSHKSQLFVYYRYTTLQDGTPVADVTWNNWYDPFVIPAGLITVDQSILSLAIAPIEGQTVVSKSGVVYNMPAMDFSNGGSLHILRSQDVDNKAVDFGAGSRVTSAGLNAAIGQVFGSVQELADRVTSLEGFNFEVPVDSGGGGGGNLTGGDKVDIFVSGVDLDTWTINAGVVDEGNLDTALVNKINSKVDAAQAADAAPVQSIVGGGSTTVTDDGNGAFTVTSTGGSSGADPELELPITSTETLGGITAGETFAAGTTLEALWNRLLVTFQVPDISNITSPNPGTVEHGTSLNWSSVSFSKTNPTNIDTTDPGDTIFTDPVGTGSVSTAFLFNTSGSQTMSQSVNTTALVTGSNPGASGTPLNQSGFRIQVRGTDTQGSSFERTESWSVRYRRYFGASTISFNGSNGSSIISDMATNGLSTNSKGTYTAPTNANGGSYDTYFVVPTCHFDGFSSIVLNGALPVYGAFTDAGVQVINGVEYTFFKSNSPGGYTPGDKLVVS